MNSIKKALAGLFAVCMTVSCIPHTAESKVISSVQAADGDISSKMEWGAVKIGGGGFVSGIVTGQKAMYARTDVGGAYRFNYETDSWEQLLGFINEDDRGLLSVDAMAIDPSDDDTAYFLCGCAYFSAEKTVIYKTTDGGKTFTESDVTDMIQVHGNGNGRQTGESIAVDPDDPNTIYCGGDVYAGDSCLIKSTDGGKTWKTVKSYGDLGLFEHEIKWPTWGSNMRKALTADEYYAQNGIACIYIYGGKVYVGASTTGKNNVVVADVKDDKFTDLSSKLDAENYPGRITGDGKGNIFFAFQGGVQVGTGGTSGSIKKLDAKSGEITDISPLAHLYDFKEEKVTNAGKGGYSGISVDPANPDHMVSSTCGLFANAQLWEPWTEEHGPCWGDKFFRSEDGGKTWREISPGYSPLWGKDPLADYLDTGGYDWIYDKAIHWVGSYVIDPVNPDRTFSTSGNGVFACDNTWSDLPQFHFQPDGIEEVVVLDFVSVPGGANYSAIGDYDGFIHDDVYNIPPQYQPNMGSTSAIAYCPADPKIMARTANGDGNNTGSGYYSKDGGKTWTAFKPACTGGKLSITKLGEGKYRIINTSAKGGASYTDDWGATWSECEGIKASKGAYTLVDPEDPSIVYASGAQFNDYWSSDMTKKEPTFEESHYSCFISEDYGKSFKEYTVCPYNWELTWKFEHTGDLAYVSKGTVALAGANQGLYLISDKGATVTKLENVEYAKCVGYGKPEKTGGPNTLFIYGKPGKDDTEGVYRSTDAGKTWVCINTDHLYGGTGNGNFLVGDMNEFGTVYMSTVGCGIIYGRIAGQEKPPTTTKTTTTKAATTATVTTTAAVTTTATGTLPTGSYGYEDDILWGDANCDKEVNLADAVLIMQSIANPDKYGAGKELGISAKGEKNADVSGNGDGLTNKDALAIQKYKLGLISSLPVTEKSDKTTA